MLTPVDKDKLAIVAEFLETCMAKGIIRKGSPQQCKLEKEAVQFCRPAPNQEQQITKALDDFRTELLAIVRRQAS